MFLMTAQRSSVRTVKRKQIWKALFTSFLPSSRWSKLHKILILFEEQFISRNLNSYYSKFIQYGSATLPS